MPGKSGACISGGIRLHGYEEHEERQRKRVPGRVVMISVREELDNLMTDDDADGGDDGRFIDDASAWLYVATLTMFVMPQPPNVPSSQE